MNMQAIDTADEFHHCPACGQRTRHRVSRDRKVAPVLWCQRCFHVHVQAQSAAVSVLSAKNGAAPVRRDVA